MTDFDSVGTFGRLLYEMSPLGLRPCSREEVQILDDPAEFQERHADVARILGKFADTLSAIESPQLRRHLLRAEILAMRALWEQKSHWRNVGLIRRLAEQLNWPQVTEKGYEFRREAWFLNHIDVFSKELAPFAGRPDLRALEVGSMEGMSCCWLLDTILTNSTCTIDCVDPKPSPLFARNMERSASQAKVTLHQEESQYALLKLQIESFDIIYVDGFHMSFAVFLDLIASWFLARQSALIIIDDYLTDSDLRGIGQYVRLGVNLFLSILSREAKPKLLFGQVFIERKNHLIEPALAATKLTDFFLAVYGDSDRTDEAAAMLRAHNSVQRGERGLWDFLQVIRDYIMVNPLKPWPEVVHHPFEEDDGWRNIKSILP